MADTLTERDKLALSWGNGYQIVFETVNPVYVKNLMDIGPAIRALDPNSKPVIRDLRKLQNQAEGSR